jgi:hypothetical protein
MWLQTFYVGDDVFNLGWFEDFFERGHHGVAVLDPGLEGFVGDLIVVHGEGATLADTLQAGADLLGVAVGVMADGAFLVEHFFAALDGGCVSACCGGFLWGGLSVGILRVDRAGDCQDSNSEHHKIAIHDSP